MGKNPSRGSMRLFWRTGGTTKQMKQGRSRVFAYFAATHKAFVDSYGYY